MIEATCLVCGGSYRDAKLPGLLACSACHFVTANISLSEGELRRLYSAGYFRGEEYKDYVAERALLEKHFRIRLKRLLRYVQAPEGKRLLEIGCAYGFFLSVARTSFREIEGLDVSEDAVQYATKELGLKATTGDFLTYEAREPVDVVCLWDTIEHLEKPHLYLERASAMMNPGAVMAITTGDIGSLAARLRGARWRQIHPPTHLQYFSKKTLVRLLAKYGFRVRYCGHEGMYRSIDTMAYIILNIKNHQPALYLFLNRSGLLRWNLYLNLYDILFVVAEKK
jgi:2-polyprenyl-3-methyl-5-hydroxy-6-metoxy-1,4-benzoquinol methylase